MPEGDFHPSDHARSRAHLLAAYGRGDSPPPASVRWPTSTRTTFSAVGHRSLPDASSHPPPGTRLGLRGGWAAFLIPHS
jgi:hypothetical protein